jgi:uncharacterized OB-fold protein
MAKPQKPIIEGLFTWPSDQPKLIGGKCRKCGVIVFPKTLYCPNPECEKDPNNMEPTLLSDHGRLWSWTITTVPPPPPFRFSEPFKPYAIGIVELPEGVKVVGLLTTTQKLNIGAEVRLKMCKLYEDEENEYITWMWDPI